MRTKKVYTTRRFGTRCGKKIRERVIEIEKEQRKKHTCPYCFKTGVKRVAAGIWECKKCGIKFAGKAYKPK